MRLLIPTITLVALAATSFTASARDPFAQSGAAPVEVGGFYSGVLIADSSASPTEPISADQVRRTEALGLFSLGVPDTGLASGDAIIFSEGRVFQGTIVGFADPDGGSLSAVINTVAGATTDDADTTGAPSLQGVLTGNIKPPTFDRSNLSNSTRLTGSAQLELSEGQTEDDGSLVVTRVIPFIMSGIQQSPTFVQESTDVPDVIIQL